MSARATALYRTKANLPHGCWLATVPIPTLYSPWVRSQNFAY